MRKYPDNLGEGMWMIGLVILTVLMIATIFYLWPMPVNGSVFISN